MTSAISLLIGATLADIAGGDPARHAALAASTALLVAVLAFVAYAIRAGAVVNFFSETVLVGFKCGVALFLASTQLPKLFGFSGSHGGDFWDRMGHFIRGLGDTNPTSLVLGLVALGLLLLGKTVLKHRPVALFVLIVGIVAAGVFNLDERGVSLLGEVPQGLPVPALPAVSRADVNTILPLAMACFVLAAVETTAIGRMFAAKHGYRLDATQEFLAIGSANLVAGLGSGFPVSGGMSQSLVNETAGARHAAFRTGGRAHHARRRGRSSRVCSAIFRNRSLARSSWWRSRVSSSIDALRTHLAIQPHGVRRCHGRAVRRAGLRAAQRRAARRRDLARAASPPCLASAGD